MVKLEATLLGLPVIKVNGKPVKFPYKKVEALLYYLLVNRKTSREKIASLLWGNMLDDDARKNLRNALYQLKQKAGTSLINTPDHSTVELNAEMEIVTDVDVFLTGEGPGAIEVYKGEFLQGLEVKKAPDFSNWLSEQRSYYRELYIRKLNHYIDELKTKKDWRQAAFYLNLLIEVDEFNETAYRDLMSVYAAQGVAAKAIEAYRGLEQRLDEEMGIAPDPATTELYKRIQKSVSSKKTAGRDFICRKKELDNLTETLQNFITGKTPSSVIVMGEAGIGKTALVEKALSSVNLRDCLVLKSNCYSAEERYIYKPWKNILEKIKAKVDIEKIDSSLPWKRIISFLFPSFLAEDEAIFYEELNFESIQHQSAVDALLHFLTEVAKQKKLIFVFEDLQWCDNKSLELLKLLIEHNKNTNILLVLTTRNERKERLMRFLCNLYHRGLMQEINLKRFNFLEVKRFVNKKLPNYHFSEDLLKTIYNETEGNPFFLEECLKLFEQNKGKEDLSDFLTSKSRDILRERIFSVSEQARRILTLVAIPFDCMSYDVLLKLSGKDELTLVKLLEELVDHYLLTEVIDDKRGKPCYKFTHTRIRDYVYKSLTYSRARLLHEKIARILEDKLSEGKNSREYYTRLIYHYQRAGNKVKHLEYLIKEADIYFHKTHELFPIVNDDELRKDKILALNQKESQRYLGEIEEVLSTLREEEYAEDLMKQEIKYLNMKALYLICHGSYDKALTYLTKMVNRACLLKDWPSAIEAYQQMAGLGIQKENERLIEDSGKKMYRLAKTMKMDKKMGVALRFLGISSLYKRKYQIAERMFNNSIQIFKKLERGREKYTLAIAALYNYLGEVKRHKGRFNEALSYYERCIGLCEARNIVCGLGVFYTNAGQVCFELQDYARAEQYFKRAVEIFQQLNTIWGYSTIANGFLALLAVLGGNYLRAYSYLQTADRIINKHYKRYWAGILFRIKTEISCRMQKDKGLRKVLGHYLSMKPEEYGLNALDVFKVIGAPYEIKTVRNLIQQ